MIPIKDKVFVRQLEAEKTTASGLKIPDTLQKKQKYGTIVHIGAYDKEKYGVLSCGDLVSFNEYAGVEVAFGEEFLVMHPECLYSKVVDGKHQAIGSSVLVELQEKYEKSKKIGELDLMLDVPIMEKGVEVFHNKGYRLKYSGKVVSVPTTRQFDSQGYEIDNIIQEGDEAYYRFINSSESGNEIGKGISDFSEQAVIRVPYEDIFCVVRDGKILPIGEWVLGESFIDGEGEDMDMPTGSGVTKIKAKMSSGGIITSVNDQVCLNKAIVRHVGSLKDNPTALREGDIVYSRGGINFENEIAGKKYFCFLESYQVDMILGNVNDKA